MASLLYNGVPADDSEEQKFECPEEGCGRCYRQRRNLMIHIKLDHTEPGAIPWHTCHADDCGKSFKYKCALNRHIVLYHSGPDAREAMLAKRRKNQEIRSFEPNEEKKWKMMIGGTENDPDSKLFQCCHDGCNRMFTSKGSLNLHIERKHERPFAFICPVASCARQFSYKHVLQTHVERVHKIPFNHEDFPNPKRQRTRKTQPISSELNIDSDEVAGTGTMMVVASDSSDSDSLNDDELEEVLMESATAKKDKGEGDSAESSARAKRAKTATAAAAAVAATTSPVSGRKRAPRSSALGSLAELAQSRLAAEGAGAQVKEGTLPVQLYECDHPGCTKVFSWKGSLSLHKERIHKTPDSYPCPVEDCRKSFSYKHVLQQHLKRVHKMDVASSAIPSVPTSSTAPNQTAANAGAGTVAEGAEADTAAAGEVVPVAEDSSSEDDDEIMGAQ